MPSISLFRNAAALTVLACFACVPAAYAQTVTITLKSDATTLGAGLGAGFPSTAMSAQLDTPNTSGLTFVPVILGSTEANPTFASPPPGAPAGTVTIDLAPGDGENGYFLTTFVLPTAFTGITLNGAANVDDTGRAFLNGNAISPSIVSNDPNRITEFGNAAFSTSNASFFHSGMNVLLISDANTGGGPSGAAFFATITYTPVVVTPEPGSVALLVGFTTTGVGFLARRRKQAHHAA